MKKLKLQFVLVESSGYWDSDWAINSRGKKITWSNYDAYFNGVKVAGVRGSLTPNSGVKYDVYFMTTLGDKVPVSDRTRIGVNKAKQLIRKVLEPLDQVSSGEYV